MLSDKLIRGLFASQRASFVPIWSCRQSQSLVPLRLAPAVSARRRFLSTEVPPPTTTVPNATGGQGSLGVTVTMQYGLPQITVPLPSRNEPCVFTLKPVTHTIGDFLDMLRQEDAGIDRAVVRTADGVRMASTTSIQTLLKNLEFDLVINDTPYRVCPPREQTELALGLSGLSGEEVQRLGDVRALVGQLYEALHVEEHQVSQEQKLVSEIELLQAELAPLEKQREDVMLQAEKKTNSLTWLGLGMMSVQFGILARLTWWEYSWDIMEPVTYFVTYGTAMACYAYFVLTKQDYILPDVRDRQFLLSFHKKARKDLWDVDRYNVLRDGIAKLEVDLKRLRDPLHLRLPAARTAVESMTSKSEGLLGAQLNIDRVKEMLKSKLS